MNDFQQWDYIEGAGVGVVARRAWRMKGESQGSNEAEDGSASKLKSRRAAKSTSQESDT
jgi:hypothetical protein